MTREPRNLVDCCERVTPPTQYQIVTVDGESKTYCSKHAVQLDSGVES